MSVLTTFLKLFKYDNTDKTNNANFNIQTALNDNWDKVEENAKAVNQEMEQITDRGFIGNTKSISNSDLNNLLQTGFYAGTNLVNAPYTGYWYVDVVSYNGSNLIKQKVVRLTGSTSGEIYERICDNTWKPWNKIATTDKVDILLFAKPSFTINSQRCYKINNVLYINVNFSGTIAQNTRTIPLSFPATIITGTGITALNITGKTASGSNMGSISASCYVNSLTDDIYVTIFNGGGVEFQISGVIVL